MSIIQKRQQWRHSYSCRFHSSYSSY